MSKTSQVDPKIVAATIEADKTMLLSDHIYDHQSVYYGFIQGAKWALTSNNTESLIQTCKECGVFIFSADGKMCANGHPVKQDSSETDKENTEMPKFDGQYLVLIHEKQEGGEGYKYWKVIECFMNQWVVDDENQEIVKWTKLPNQ